MRNKLKEEDLEALFYFFELNGMTYTYDPTLFDKYNCSICRERASNLFAICNTPDNNIDRGYEQINTNISNVDHIANLCSDCASDLYSRENYSVMNFGNFSVAIEFFINNPIHKNLIDRYLFLDEDSIQNIRESPEFHAARSEREQRLLARKISNYSFELSQTKDKSAVIWITAFVTIIIMQLLNTYF